MVITSNISTYIKVIIREVNIYKNAKYLRTVKAMQWHHPGEDKMHSARKTQLTFVKGFTSSIINYIYIYFVVAHSYNKNNSNYKVNITLP